MAKDFAFRDQLVKFRSFVDSSLAAKSGELFDNTMQVFLFRIYYHLRSTVSVIVFSFMFIFQTDSFPRQL